MYQFVAIIDLFIRYTYWLNTQAHCIWLLAVYIKKFIYVFTLLLALLMSHAKNNWLRDCQQTCHCLVYHA